MKYFKWLLLVLILIDWGHTYIQNYHLMFLDGDLLGVVGPYDGYKKVLSDPLGLSVILNDEVYPATNRFFFHYFLYQTFRNLPHFFQLFTDPIDSLYVSMAFARTFIQVIIIFLIAIYISANNKARITSTGIIVAMALVTPLFQIHGYNRFMGITNITISYTFAYALPFIFILLYFLPFYLKKLNFLMHFVLIALAFIIALGGPVGPPIILIGCPLILLIYFIENYRNTAGTYWKRIKLSISQLNKPLLFHFSFIIILCLYSMYIGTNNSENSWYSMSLIERYKLLPQGFWNIMTEKLGPLFLLIIIIINLILIKIITRNEGKKVLRIVNWILICCLIYLILLPLGGYRGYRPFIIRDDTFSPVSLSLIFSYGLSSFYLLFHLKGKVKKLYIIALVAIAFIYTNADKKIQWNLNECEREALRTIAESDKHIVELYGWCPVLAWHRFKDYNESRLGSELLVGWNVLKEEKLYYFPEE